MKKTINKREELTTKNLQVALWETLRAVKSKKMKPAEANAVAATARGICQVAKLNIEYMKLSGVKPSKEGAYLLA